MANDLEIRESDPVETTKLAVRLSRDRTEVLLDCPDPLARLSTTVELVMAEFETLGLPQHPDKEQLAEMITAVALPDEDLHEMVLIRSEAPTPTIHGRLEWTREFFDDGFVIDEETDTIDFRERVGNCAVRRNELLVRRHEPREGEPGTDVFGHEIPVDKPETTAIRCGKGVVEILSEDAASYFAELDGRVVFKDGMVSVDEVFALSGDVDLKSGNIHHTGSITISGDIRNGAQVEADGDIIVKGLVEQSNVRCGGNLVVAGGIIGDEEHSLAVGGNLEARYIRDADIKVDGDVLVLREITHCQLRCLGKIQVPKGRIVGGESVALKGICVDTAGAPGSADTILRAGVDHTLESRLSLLHEKIERLEANLVLVQAALDNASNSDAEHSEAVTKVIESLAEKRMMIGHTITMEYMCVENLQESALEEADPRVVMTREVWSGTTIFLGESQTRVKRSIDKPRLALLKDDRARVVPLGEANMPDNGLVP